MIERSKNQFYLGDLTYFPRVVAPVYAYTEIPSMAYQTINTSITRQRFDDYADPKLGGKVHNVSLSSELSGMMLNHNGTYDVPPMSLDYATVSSGELQLCLPYGFDKPNPLDPSKPLPYHLLMSNNAPDVTTTVQFTKFLVEQPCFILHFTRAVEPPEGMSVGDQVWRLTFGDDYTLEWSRLAPARLVYHYGLADEFVVATRHRDDVRNTAYSVDGQMVFQVYNLLNNLYITSTAWSGPWVIRLSKIEIDGKPLPGVIKAAPPRMTGSGGRFAINLSHLTFESTGYIETDWVDVPYYYDYDDSPYDPAIAPHGMIGTVWPAQAPGCAAAVSVIESRVYPNVTNPTKYQKRYRVSMSAPEYAPGYSYTTPVVQAFEYKWDAEFTPGTGELVEITPWWDIQRGATESKSVDMAPCSLTLSLQPMKIVGGKTLWQHIYDSLGELRGTYAFVYEVGNVLSGDYPGDDQQQRMAGYIDVTDLKQASSELDSIEITAVGSWALPATETARWAPTGSGMSVEDAIEMWLNSAGVHSIRITKTATGFKLDKLEPDGDFAGSVPWQVVNGSLYGDTIREAAEMYGVEVREDGQGNFHVGPRKLLASVATYSAQYGASEDESVSSWTDREDMSDMQNFVLVEGVRPDGRPLVGIKVDYDSVNTPHTPHYAGRYRMAWKKKSDLNKKSSVKLVAQRMFAWRKGGFVSHVLTGMTSDLWKRYPGERITLHDSDGNTKTLYITSVSNQLGMMNEPTVVGEERS